MGSILKWSSFWMIWGYPAILGDLHIGKKHIKLMSDYQFLWLWVKLSTTSANVFMEVY